MEGLQNLPLELVETIILENNEVKIKDVFNLLRSCKAMQHLIGNNQRLWTIKFAQCYPRTYTMITNFIDGKTTRNWKEESKKASFYETMVETHLQFLAKTSFMKPYLDYYDLEEYRRLIQHDHECAYMFIDILMGLIHSKDSDLTTKYYAEKVLRGIREYLVKKQWRRLATANDKFKTFERAAVLIAQWLQPTIDLTMRRIRKKLDEIAIKVIHEVRLETNGNHPLLNVSDEQLRSWSMYTINNNMWSADECVVVIRAVSHVLFMQMGFQYSPDCILEPSNVFINKVLERRRGMASILSVIYESVARRVGVKCTAISFPGPNHFVLRWCTDYRVFDEDGHNIFYIDIFNTGALLDNVSCPRFRTDCHSTLMKYENLRMDEVGMELAMNFELACKQKATLVSSREKLKAGQDLYHMMSPIDTAYLNKYILFHVSFKLDMTRILEELEIVRRTYPQLISRDYLNYVSESNLKHRNMVINYKRKPALRDENCSVQFGVGMVMYHKVNHYYCAIYGWDTKCMNKEKYMQYMDEYKTPRQMLQPFYRVLVDDGSLAYIAEDNLIVPSADADTLNLEIKGIHVGRYFSKFNGYYYLPNKTTAYEYPDDMYSKEFIKSCTVNSRKRSHDQI